MGFLSLLMNGHMGGHGSKIFHHETIWSGQNKILAGNERRETQIDYMM